MKKALTHIGQEKSYVASGAYLGQKKPKLQPEIFAPDIVSKMEEYEFGSVFPNDANGNYIQLIQPFTTRNFFI